MPPPCPVSRNSSENRHDVLRPTSATNAIKPFSSQNRKGSTDGEFTGFSLDISATDEIVIDDQDSDPEPAPKKRVLSVDRTKGMAFDFSADPRLNSIKKSVNSIVDPDGRKGISNSQLGAIAKSIEVVNSKREKKTKPWERKVPINLDDFRMASGNKIVKEMKQVVNSNENSDDSQQSDSGGYHPSTGQKRYFGNKKVNSINSNTSTAANMIKKGLSQMGMGVDGSSRDEPVVSGLRAEPSLKHFDEQIISLIESEIMSITTETGWSDVAGLEGAKKALREIVVLPFKRPDVFTGIRAPPKGVLLFGPPGTGKTMIGKCVASQCKATFFNISASSLTSKWVGEGEKLVRALFSVARLKLPSVIFIDEIDSLLSARSESEHESSRRIKTEFLVQLDGVATNSDERLLVLGATNRPQELDEAARRRFAKRLYIALPEDEARLSIVRNLLKTMSHSIEGEGLKKIAELTKGYSGADMRQLCAEAAMGPIRDIENSSSMDIETVATSDIRPINIEDFIEASRVVRPTVVEEDLIAYEAWDKKFGCLL
ncbi:unnamed protein product [Auanema sp. JU1783]|nr:unnamed protein product [Auanema sp. JU1783]